MKNNAQYLGVIVFAAMVIALLLGAVLTHGHNTAGAEEPVICSQAGSGNC